MGLGLEQQQKLYSGLSTNIIKIGTDSDDPTTNITDNGDETLNVNFAGIFRIVDRVNDSNGSPANNQFSKSRSRVLNWAAQSNIDHSSFSDGNILVIVDNTGTISIVQLATGEALLPIFSNSEPNINTHIQIGSLTKDSNVVVAGSVVSKVATDSNIQNKLRNITRILGTINTLDDPVIISPIIATIGISTNAGIAFIAADDGYVETGGINPNQFTVTASSPTLILTVNRAGTGNIVNVSTSLNVTQFEDPLNPGTFIAIGSSKAANRFIMAFATFNAELLGQTTYSGGSRLIDASEANEPLDIPNIAIFGGKISQVSVENAATDLSLVAQAIFKDLKQFR